MPMGSNAYYGDVNLNDGIKSLGTAIFGDPNTMGRNVMWANQAAYDRARAEQEAEKNRRAAESQKALATLGDVINEAIYYTAPGPNLDGSAGVRTMRSQDDVLAQMPRLAGQAALAYPNKSDAMGEIFRTVAAMTGYDDLGRRGLVATGHQPNKDFAMDIPRADAISARDAEEQRAREVELEEMRQVGAKERTRMTNETSRLNNADTNATSSRNSQRTDDRSLAIVFSGKYDENGQPIYVYAQKAQAAGQRAPTPAGAQPKTAKGTKMSKIAPKDLETINEQIAAQMGVSTKDVATLLSQMPAEDRALYNEAIAAGWGSGEESGNAAGAIAEGVRFLSGKTEMQNSGGISGLFGSTELGVKKPPAAPVVTPPPVASPAAQPAAGAMPPAPRNPADRKANTVYDTPKGPMFWTGTGWKPVVPGGA